MTPERARLLAKLLTEVYEEDKGFIPEPAYIPFHKLCSWGAAELLVVRKNGQEVLLRYRSDYPWNGWHIIGGYIRPFESISAFADRAIREEEAGLTGVTNFKQIAIAKWLDHPTGFLRFPFCALFVCEPVGDVIEREDLRWFSIGNLPFGRMIHPKHDLYLMVYLKYLKNPERYCSIIGE